MCVPYWWCTKHAQLIMGTWPIYKKHFLQLILTKKKLSFDKISPRDFYFFSFLFNLYLLLYICSNTFQNTCNRFNTLRPRQIGRLFPGDILKWIFLNENVWISIKISLKFVPMGQINNIPALVQIMAWRRPGDKPLFEPKMISLLTHICVTRPQWVNTSKRFEQMFSKVRKEQ